MKNDNHMNSFSSLGGGVAIKNKSERKQKVYFKVKLLRKIMMFSFLQGYHHRF